MKGFKYYLSLGFFFLIAVIIYLSVIMPDFKIHVMEYLKISTEDLIAVIPKLIFLAIMVFGTKYFIKFTSEVIKRHYEKTKSKMDLKLLLSVYSYGIWIVAILTIISVVYKIVGSMLMSISIFAFGITIALQKPIMNFAGWLSIVYTKPFTIGDRVTIGISYNRVKGDVFDITIMNTMLSEIDDATDQPSGRALIVPNEKIITEPILNLTKGSPFIWDNLIINITTNSDWKSAVSKLNNAANLVVGNLMKKESEKWIQLKEKKDDIQSMPKVNVSIGDSSIKLELRYLCNVHNIKDTRTRITEHFLEAISKAKKIKLRSSV